MPKVALLIEAEPDELKRILDTLTGPGTPAVPTPVADALVEHVVRRTKVGRTVVRPLAERMTPGQSYTAEELGRLLGGWTARQVATKLTVLGRSEKEHRRRIFDRPEEGRYALTAEMRDAILAVAA